MDTTAAIGLIALLSAVLVFLRMEPGIVRLIRRRLNARQRNRMRAGFAMRRSTHFKDGAIL